MESRTPAFALLAAGLLGMSLCAFAWIGQTAQEQKQATTQKISLREYAQNKRNVFLGHREMADLMDGMAVVATTIDLFSNRNSKSAKEIAGTKLHQRFLDSLNTVRDLSKYSLGMDEIYFFPAMYLLFEDIEAEQAISIIDLGVQDQQTQARIPLLGAYIAHVFLRNPIQAGRYYLEIPKRYKDTPEWVTQLGERLARGDDPIDTNVEVRQKLLETMKTAFPEAKRYIERYQRSIQEDSHE